jgi:poly(3-hydroxybutyrate) depolymerase
MVASVDETIALWKKLNRCADPPKIRELPDRDPSDATSTVEYVWNCAEQVEVRQFRVEGGAHSWQGPVTPPAPTKSKGPGTVSRDFSGAEEMWRFLSRFRLPERK